MNKIKKITALILSIMAVIPVLLSSAMAVSVSDTYNKPTIMESEELINAFFAAINERNYNLIPDMVDTSQQAEMADFVADGQNRANHAGLFNISKSHVCALAPTSELKACDSYSSEYFRTYVAIVNVVAFSEDEYYHNGYNPLIIVVGKENGKPVLFEVSTNPFEDIDQYLPQDGCPECQTASTNSYDTPYASTYEWTLPSTIKVRNYGTVNFKEYVKTVLPNEIDSTFGTNALKAVAVAIKQFGWFRTIRKKYVNYSYDVVEDHGDQVYNPSKSRFTAGNNAVDNTWGYMMLDSSYKIFPSFHVNGDNPLATYKNIGRLSQNGAKALDAQGKTWQEILHYFYDYGSSVTRKEGTYNDEMSHGNIIILNINHSITGSGVWTKYSSTMHYIKTCTTCHTKHREPHTFVYNSKTHMYTCSKCGYTTSDAAIVACVKNPLLYETILPSER